MMGHEIDIFNYILVVSLSKQYSCAYDRPVLYALFDEGRKCEFDTTAAHC